MTGSTRKKAGGEEKPVQADVPLPVPTLDNLLKKALQTDQRASELKSAATEANLVATDATATAIEAFDAIYEALLDLRDSQESAAFKQSRLKVLLDKAARR